MTRSETRRRSGLGLGIDLPVGALIGMDGGGALGETSKSRATGNREIGHTADILLAYGT